MMRERAKPRGIAIAIILVLLSTAQARAEVREFLNYCKTGSLRPCASVRVQAIDMGGTTHVILWARNDGWAPGGGAGPTAIYQIEVQGYDDTFDGMAASNLTVSTEGGAAFVGPPGSDSWYIDMQDDEVEFNVSLNGGAIYGCDVTGVSQPYFQTCGENAWVVFNFDLGGSWDVDQIHMRGIEWELATADIPEIQCKTWSDDCVPGGGATTAPEPVTMVLLASGLAGIGGAGLLGRRRRRLEGLDDG